MCRRLSYKRLKSERPMNLDLFLRRLLMLLTCAGLFTAATFPAMAADPGPSTPAAASAPAATPDTHGHDSAASAAEVPTLLESFGYSYLTAFLFFLSLALGGLMFVMIHHLFDAALGVPVLRLAEHLACLFRPLFILLIPLLVLQRSIWPWITVDPATDHSLDVKKDMLNPIMF